MLKKFPALSLGGIPSTPLPDCLPCREAGSVLDLQKPLVPEYQDQAHTSQMLDCSFIVSGLKTEPSLEEWSAPARSAVSQAIHKVSIATTWGVRSSPIGAGDRKSFRQAFRYRSPPKQVHEGGSGSKSEISFQ